MGSQGHSSGAMQPRKVAHKSSQCLSVSVVLVFEESWWARSVLLTLSPPTGTVWGLGQFEGAVGTRVERQVAAGQRGL